MTQNQVLAVAAIGGLAAVLSLIAIVGLALTVHAAAARIVDLREARRERRRAARQTAADLATCQAITALGTTTEQDSE
ncbi:hypothetical protein [Streptomyces sp. NPDC002328]|uniref:hypothetical protein n=1 Tax=Streptomyces sp. NPDC002328 TaxID=3364642 RepID=UPI0036B3C8F8